MAVITVGGGGASKLLIIGAIIAIIALVLYIRKNPNFLKNLMGGGAKIGAAVEGITRLSNRMMCRRGL